MRPGKRKEQKGHPQGLFWSLRTTCPCKYTTCAWTAVKKRSSRGLGERRGMVLLHRMVQRQGLGGLGVGSPLWPDLGSTHTGWSGRGAGMSR